MKSRKLYCLLFLLTTFSINNSFAQSKANSDKLNPEYTNAYLGLGIGFDYGAIGIKAEFLPSKYIGIFGGVGYALIDPAFNVGLSGKLLPDRNLCPTVTAMYGYNAVIKLQGTYGPTVSGSKIYYGPTFGAGGELKTGKTKNNKLSFGIWLPFRNPDFQKEYDGLKDSGYEFQQDILPVAFSIGFNFGIGRKVDKE